LRVQAQSGWVMKRKGFVFAAGLILVAGMGTAATSVAPEISFVRSATTTPEVPFGPPPAFGVRHLPTPVPLKAIYMTQCAVGTPSLRKSLVELIDSTELNSVVIDIRDYTGKIAFPTENPILKGMVSEKCGAKDMKEFVEKLHEKNIYVIGRITVFQNPYYTSVHPELAVQKKCGPSTEVGTCGVWKDHKGLAFVDVGAKPYWETVAELSKESYALGFDELNFDYIRFPSDGPMGEAVYSWSMGKNKQIALEEFYRYLYNELKPIGAVLSADLFGMVTTNVDDLNIGQQLERALPYFDYIAPMVYPSHYPKGFRGHANVNEYSYDIVHFSMSSAVRRTLATSTAIGSFAYERIHSTSSGQVGTSTPASAEASAGKPALYLKPSYPASKLRPWLQSFDYPVAYTPAMVAEQIKANEDAGLDSYMFWDPANKYRSLKAVLKPVE